MPEHWPPPRPGDADPSPASPPIVFVGGTGRSGTHVIASLLGHHPRYADVKVEARFHSNPGGLPDLLAGEVTLRYFVRKLRRFWWYRIAGGVKLGVIEIPSLIVIEPLPVILRHLHLGRSVRGLHQVIPRRRLDRAVERFSRRWERDPETASRRLFLELLWPVVTRAGKLGLVEMTTSTVQQAPSLSRLFPEAKFIHCIRDGRDCGSSKVVKRQKRKHPRDAFEGLRWWAERLERNERAIAAMPSEKVLNLNLDQLVGGDRDGAYGSLLAFLGIEDERSIRRYFETQVTEENANRGRWRCGLSDQQQVELTRRYERALKEMHARGFASAPVLSDAYRRLG